MKCGCGKMALFGRLCWECRGRILRKIVPPPPPLVAHEDMDLDTKNGKRWRSLTPQAIAIRMSIRD